MKPIIFFRISKVALVLAFTLLAGILLNSCSCDREKKDYMRDIASNDMDSLKNIVVKIDRYEKDLFSIPEDSLKQGLVKMQDKYSFFYDADQLNDSMNLIVMQQYLKDPTIKSLYAEVMKQFSDISSLEMELTKMFRKVKYYLPDWEVPKVFTYVSGGDMQFPVKYADNTLVIALDMFLGEDFPIYAMWGVPDYVSNRMSNDYLIIACAHEIARAYIESMAVDPKTMLDYMVYNGKLLYFTDLVVENREDSVKIGYSAPQYFWAEKNQGNVWGFFIEHNLLYTTEFRDINKFIGEAPFTSAFSRNSAPRVGCFVGWQIVRAYMSRNKDIDVETVLKNTNSQEILNKSAYKPKKEEQ